MGRTLIRTRRSGGSLVVTLPKELVQAEGLAEGMLVEITVRKLRKEGFGILRGIRPFTAKDELKTHE